MRDLLHDVRLALRGLMSRPGFALVAVSTITLGIGAAGAIWSVVDAVLVRPLPFSQPERLVFVWESQLARHRDRNVVGPANLVSWRERARSVRRSCRSHLLMLLGSVVHELVRRLICAAGNPALRRRGGRPKSFATKSGRSFTGAPGCGCGRRCPRRAALRHPRRRLRVYRKCAVESEARAFW